MTNWTKHTGTGTGMPGKLAQAQIVEVEWPFKATPGRHLHRVSSLNWLEDTFYYRPALDPDGLPYVSAEGLGGWSEYVAVDPEDWRAFQFASRPRLYKGIWKVPGSDHRRCRWSPAPSTHAIPGPPENSLASVWRE